MHTFGSGSKMDSEEWQAWADFLFGTPVKPSNGSGDIPIYLRNKVKQPIHYGCMHCEATFISLITPTKCPLCGKEPDERGILLSHKGHVARTFAFSMETPTTTIHSD